MSFTRFNFKILCSLCVFFHVLACVSIKEIRRDFFSQSEIYENLNISKNELFRKTNKWILETFDSPKKAIQYSDKEEGIIRLNFNMTNFEPPSYVLGYMPANFNITIQVKDSKARISLEATSQIRATDQGFLNLKNMLSELLQSFEESLKKEDENW